MIKIRTLGAAALSLAVVACATPSTPSITRVDKRAAEIKFSDIDFATEAGQEELRDRVAEAAYIVCHPARSADPFAAYHRRSCIETIVKNFAAQAEAVGLDRDAMLVRALEVNDVREY